MKQKSFKTQKNGNLDFTLLGFGGVPIGNLYRELADEEAYATVRTAWDEGIRYFDTAAQYGHGRSETRMGKVLRDYKREDYLLSTKVGRILEPCAPGEENSGHFVNPPPFKIRYDYSYEGVMRALDEGLERLGHDYADIVYIHDVDVITHGSVEASDRRIDEVMKGGYHALTKLRDEGVIKAIGAGVNEWEVCEKLANRGDFDLFLLAGRYTLLEQTALDSFLPMCEERGIGIVLGGPYNSGILATGPIPGAKYDYTDASPEICAQVQKIQDVCQSHGVELAQAALWFPLGHPAVVSVIPGGQTPDEVRRNIKTLEKPIPEGLWAELKEKGLMRKDAPVPDTTNM